MKKILFASSAFLLPALTAFAQGPSGGTLTNISQVIQRFQAVINIVIPFIIGLAVLVIIYGIFSFISSAGDEEARGTAKQFIIWGIIGVFLMLSVWGLVTILYNSFGTDAAAAKNASIGNTIPVIDPATTGGF